MENIIERIIVPRNPAPSAIINKEKYMLFAPISRRGQPGIAEFDEAHFKMRGQVVYVNTDNIATVEFVTRTTNELHQYIDTLSTSVLTQAKQYASNIGDGVLFAAKQHTSAVGEGVLAEAKQHTSAVGEGVLAEAKQHTSAVGEGVLVEAKRYADGEASTAEQRAIQEAKRHANSVSSQTLTDAKGYADDKGNDVLTQAKAYTDTLVSASWTRVIVESLDEILEPKSNVIYMVKRPVGLAGGDAYDEYFFYVDEHGEGRFELMGNTELDLSQYTPIGDENAPPDDKSYYGLYRSIAASKKEAQNYANSVAANVRDLAIKLAADKVPIGTPSPFTQGIMLYGQSPDGSIAFKHATTRAGGNEVPIRDSFGRLGNSWQDLPSEYVVAKGWDKGTCMPKHYIDALVKGGTFQKRDKDGKVIATETLGGYAPLVGGKVPERYLPSSDPTPNAYDIIITSQEQFLAEKANFAGKKILLKDVNLSLGMIDFANAEYVEFCNVAVGSEGEVPSVYIYNFKIGNFIGLTRGWDGDNGWYYCDNLYVEDFAFVENLIPPQSNVHGSGDNIIYSNGLGIMNCAISGATDCCNIVNCHVIGRNDVLFTNCASISNLHGGAIHVSRIVFDKCTNLSNIALSEVSSALGIDYIDCSSVDPDTCDGYVGASGASELPEVTEEDDGKILQVVGGAWTAVAIPNAEGGSF